MTISTIKPSGSGGDYTSLSSWWAVAQLDLSVPQEAECYIFPSGLTDNLALGGGTNTLATTVRIYTPLSERHDGTVGTGFRIISNTGAGTIRPTTIGFLDIEGIEIDGNGAAGVLLSDNFATYTSSDIRLSKSILHNTAAGTANTPVFMRKANSTFDSRNNSFYNCGRGPDMRGSVSAFSYDTIYKCGDLGILALTASSVTDCYSGGHTNQDFWTGGTPPGGSNNASSDATATIDYTASLINKAPVDQFVSITPGSEDLHVKSGNALAGAGIPIAGITTDIDGDPRSPTTPTIGSDEGGAAPVTFPPKLIKTTTLGFSGLDGLIS